MPNSDLISYSVFEQPSYNLDPGGLFLLAKTRYGAKKPTSIWRQPKARFTRLHEDAALSRGTIDASTSPACGYTCGHCDTMNPRGAMHF